MADEESKKAFIDAQMRLQDLSRQMANCKAQIFQRDRDSRMADVTAAELDSLRAAEPELVTYQSVGKMFLKVDSAEIAKDLRVKSEKFKREVNVLQKTKEYMDKNIQDTEKTLQEIFKGQRAYVKA